MPWADKFVSSKGIRDICRKVIIDTVFSPMKTEKEWKVLIVDKYGMKIMSSCFKTEEVMSYNIALIENLESPRSPLPYLSAIYFLHPTAETIGILVNDLSSGPFRRLYLSFHLFFLSAVHDEFFKELLHSSASDLIVTFKEIDFLFFPYESLVFSLSDNTFFPIFFDAYKEMDLEYCAFVAKRLATLCTILKIRPRIRYRRNFVKNLILSEELQRELDSYPQELFSTSSVSLNRKPRCELLILDRGFDCISPVVHEFTLQAMACDLLNIEDDIFAFAEEDEGNNKINEISLTEDESLWCQLRHEHIANVAKILDSMAQTNSLLKNNPSATRYKKLPELGEIVKKHIAFRETQPHFFYRQMANECLKIFCDGINNLSEVEQDLAMATISKTEIKDAPTKILNILRNESYSLTDKLRLLLLHIFYLKGITTPDLKSILKKSNILFSEARHITNVLHLDVDMFRPEHCKGVDYVQNEAYEEAYSSTTVFKQSRWVPAVKNIILSCIDGSLSQDKYPYVDSNERISLTAARPGYWCADKRDEHVSNLIVFVAGGITYSEMRTAYEIVNKYKGWQIYIGGDAILTPKKFLDKLKELRCFIANND